MSEKLIFPIGFDLEEGVKEASKEWKSTYQKQLQKAIDDKPLKVKIDFESKGIDTKEFKQWMALSREAEKLERERIKNAKEWQKVADQQAMAETRRVNATNESNARIERANRKAEASEQRKRTAVERTNAAYKTQSTYLSRLVQRMVAYASVAQAFSFLRNIRDVTKEFELQRVALGSIIGDLNEANAMFEQIKAAAVKSPFQIKELVTYTKQLAAYKIESDELFETTQRLADISAGLGVSMDRLVLAYGQIRATGYLRGSEVRQLTEAGIPIVEELAKKMSQLRGETISAAEVMGLISERAISFGMVKEVFDDMTSAGGMFYKMQEKQAETLAGQWSNLQDAISIMYEEIGNTEGVNNAMKGMIGLVKSLAENWQLLGNILKITAYQYGAIYAVSLFIPRLLQSTKLLQMAEEAHAKAKKMSNAATQRGSAIMAFSAKQTRIYAYWMRQAANAHTMFGRGVKRIAAMFLGGGWIGAVISVLTVAVSWLISARQEANRLNKELAKIGTEGALQADQSVRNFERLAKVIRESADGSAKQTEALEEMKRAYGEFLPSQDKSIINLVREKDGYNAVTQAIREKIALQIQEQKLNTIASEYGSRITKKEIKLKDWLTGEDWRSVDTFSKDEANRITNAIKQAVADGLINGTNNWGENVYEIEKIIKEQTGKFTNVDIMRGIERQKYEEFVNVLLDMNDAIKEVESTTQSATGTLGKYTGMYNQFQKTLEDVTGTGEKFSFEWNESKTKAEIKAYNEFIGGLLAKEGIKFDIGEAIDFKGLYEVLGDNYPQLKQVVAKIQKEYEKLIPTDITRLANDKLQEYAEKVGISMDEVQSYLKNNEQSTEDWAKGLKGAYESAEKKLAEYKKNQEAFDTHGAPFRDWSEDIEETTKEMEVLKLLMDFFKEFLSQSGGGKETNPRIALLNEELSTVEKIYKEYQELRKFMSEDDARARIADIFEGVNLTMLSQALSPAEMRQQLQKALDEAKKMGDKKQILELEYKLGKFNVAEEQRKLEKSLKDLSDKISRTKTAKEFFDRMLGMSGDREFSASLTLSVYGEGGDLGKKLAEQTIEQLETAFEGVDISSAIDKTTGKVNYAKLAPLVEQLPEKAQANAQALVDAGKKANADWLIDLQKTYGKSLTFDERRTQVINQEAQKQREIMASALPDKDKWIEASKNYLAQQLADIDFEEFKASADYIKIFEDLDNLATPTVERLLTELKKQIEAYKDLDPEKAKTLMNEYQKLYDGLINRNPFKAIADGIKEYSEALKSGDKDAKRSAITKVIKGFEGIENVFSSAANSVNELAKSLGFAENSDTAVFLQGIAKAFGFVATSITLAKVAMDLFDKETKKFLTTNPFGWVLAIGSAVVGVLSAISNAKVSRADREIERLQDHLDNLEYSYERLQKAQEKAFSSDYISNYEQRLANLQAQQEAYLKQSEAERSKGKKADEGKIKEYEEQARDTADAIKDMQSELSEHFLGTDITSAARDFANAWIDAYKEFGSTTDAMKAKFQDMIQNMIVESFAARVIQSALSDIFKEIDAMVGDGILDVSEASKIADMTEVAVGNIDVGMTNLMNALSQAGISVRGMGSDLTGISRDIATASEESILGLAAGINTQNFYISQVPTKLDTIIGLLRGENAMQGSALTLQDLVTIQNQHLSHLPSIAQNTADTVARCERAAVACERVADQLDRVIKPRGTQATHVVNTSL